LAERALLGAEVSEVVWIHLDPLCQNRRVFVVSLVEWRYPHGRTDGMQYENNPFSEVIVERYFVGRENHLQQFRRVLSGLELRTPTHMYIAGEHGTGKTSYLMRLREEARSSGYTGAFVNLNEHPPKQQVETIVRSVLVDMRESMQDAAAKKAADGLLRDWDQRANSTYFQVPRNDRVDAGDLQADAHKIASVATELGTKGIVVCIDEAQRIEPIALSTIKNALQHVPSYLIVLSIRVDNSPAVEQGRLILDRIAEAAEHDRGASRFYMSGRPLGPFDTDEEAKQCITTRLVNNVVVFDTSLIARICEASGRIPRELIALSHDVYEISADHNVQKPPADTLDVAFRSRNAALVTEANTVVAETSERAKTLLRKFVEFDRKVSVDAIVSTVFPAADPSTLATRVQQILTELAVLANGGFGIVVEHEEYGFSDATIRYAVKLALGE
jgi:hypothetical protein